MVKFALRYLSFIYRWFVRHMFKPFSAGIHSDGVYGQLLTELENYKTDVSFQVRQ